MKTFEADYLLPIAAPPIRGGSVTVDAGRIVNVGDGPSAKRVRLGHVAVLPALVNAHTHLELSYLHRRVPPSTSFNEWVMAMMTLRRTFPDSGPPPIVEAARLAITRARDTGTGLFGDVSNTLVTVPLLREMGMPAHVFYELLGFNHPDATGRVAEARLKVREVSADASVVSGFSRTEVRVGVAPHAPYSVSAELFTAIRTELDRDQNSVTTVHLGESPEEVEFLREGTGKVRTMLERLGVWTSDWKTPGVSPVEYLAGIGFLDSQVLVVHGVQFSGADLQRLASIGATLVSCPRSNAYVGVGTPPLESFYRSGVSVALGTDSLASVADLNMFAELAEARRIAPGVPARELLRSATLTGARALRFDDDYGSIETGKRAALIAVRVPTNVNDVEEYLVSGIEQDAVTWLDTVHG